MAPLMNPIMLALLLLFPSQVCAAPCIEDVTFVTGLPEEQTVICSVLAGVISIIISIDALLECLT